jgi:hypothetical protein
LPVGPAAPATLSSSSMVGSLVLDFFVLFLFGFFFFFFFFFLRSAIHPLGPGCQV